MRFSRMAAAVSFALGVFAFNGDARAQTVAGSYTLFQVNGQPLPVLTEEENGCREDVIVATLTLEAGGAWRMNYTERETCGAEVEEDIEDISGEYIAEGTTIVFSDEDRSDSARDEIAIDQLGIGSLAGDVLTVTLEDRRTLLSFRR